MASFNKITLVGNVGRDPELRQAGNSKVVDFSIAINEPARGQQPERTEWYRVTFWEKRAETIAQFVRKGTQILVEGRLSVRTYTDPSTQRERYSLDVTGTDFVLLGSRQNNEDGSGAPMESRPQMASGPQPPPANAMPAQSFNANPSPSTPPSAPMKPNAAEEDDLPF